MSKSKFLRMMESTLQIAENSLSGPEVLEEFDSWDSLTVMMTLALFDKELGLKVPAAKIYECQTINDLIALADGKITD